MRSPIDNLTWLVALALTLAPSAASAGSHFQDRGDITVGVLGGVDFPIAQEDAAWGPAYGARVRVGILPTLAAEAIFDFVQDGDAQTLSGGALPAPSARNLALGLVARSGRRGFGLAFATGLGWTTIDFPGEIESRRGVSWYLAPAFELPLGPIRIDAGPRLLVVGQDGSGTRKHLGAQLGLSYGF